MNGNIEFYRRLHKIAEQIVDDGSADADAAAALKTATLELASRYSNPQYALETIYSGDTELSKALRAAVAIVTKDDADDDADEIAKAARDAHSGQHGLGAAIVQHLLDRLDGLRRQHGFTKAKEQPTMSLIESFQNVAKTHGVPGVVEIAKNIDEKQKSLGLTEEEFCKLIDTAARVTHPELGASAFEKVFEHNPVLAKAVSVIKAGPFDIQPTMVGGVDATHEANDDEQSEAARQLGEMAEKLRATSPWLSADQAFARVFENPKNGTLAAKMHRRPSATTSYPFPR
jgi:DNA-binding ferritin-like protein